MTTNGYLGSQMSNSLSYDMFRQGYYIAGFDMSTAQEGANDPYSIPAVRTGDILKNIITKKVQKELAF